MLAQVLYFSPGFSFFFSNSQ